MNKVIVHNIVNLIAYFVIWIGLIYLVCKAVNLAAWWEILIAAGVLMPVAGYLVLYLVTPLLDSMVSKVFARFGLDKIEPPNDRKPR